MTAASAAPASAEVISLSDERASIRRRLLRGRAREVGERAFRAPALTMRMALIQRRTSLRSMNRASLLRSCR